MNNFTKTMIISLLLIITMPMAKLSAQVSTWDGTWEPWTHGTGTEADPFLIENAQQLAYLAYRVNNGLDAGGGHVSDHDYHYKLMVDVDLNGSEDFQWTPIGYWNSDADYQCFGGNLDGNNHTVSGLYINSVADCVGFIATTDGATVMDLQLYGETVYTTGSQAGGIIGADYSLNSLTCITNCSSNITNGISASQNAGGIVGLSRIVNIINCHSTGSVSIISNNYNASSGGIIGCAVSSTIITNCYNKGKITGFFYNTGGIVGRTTSNSISITNCYNTGNIESHFSGGIVGFHTADLVIIVNCYNTGDVSSLNSTSTTDKAGGIIGYAYHTAKVFNCYNTSSFIESTCPGGIIGYNESSLTTVNNSYYLNTCNGNNTYGGQPMSSDAMKTEEFVDMLNEGTCAWEYDYNNTNSGYPILTMIIVDANTSDATDITQSHATLQGILNIENTNVHAQGFEYKKTTDSNYQTINVSGNGNISQTLSRLTPNTEYTYRVFCTPVDCGTYYGEEKTFTTLPVSVTTYTATDVTQTHATLNGNLNVGDANVTAQGFEYKQSSDLSYQTISVSGNGNVSQTLLGLVPNASYTYRTFCTVTGCETVYGEEKTFTTLPVSIATNLATDVTQTHATLNGNLNIGDANISSQGFQYKKTTEYEYQIVAISGNGGISTTLSNLIPNTQYRFRVFCTPQDCATVYGQEMTFNTLTINVTTYPASNITESSATLNGYIEAGDAEVTDKGFRFWPTNDPQDVSTVSVSTTGNISATINNLAQNIYQYRAFVESNGDTYQGGIKEFEISWLNNDTIFVYDADKLHWVAEQCNSGVTFEGKCVKLMNDIELPLNVPNNMISIGSYPDHPFKGTFDGNGKLIYNLYIDQPNTPYQGFFGYTLNAYLYNVGLVNITASGRNYTGGMVAYAKNTYMRDCYVNGGTLFALSYCGGLVGYQEQGTNSIISGCYNTCTVSGNHYVGGLVGFSNYGTVRNSYVAAPVSGQGNGIGAIIGGANEVLMYYTYFSTEITGQTNAIGENNFKDGEGMTNAQMRDPQFVNTLNQNLVTPVWMADYTNHINNGFPIIKWQRPGTGVEEHDTAKSYVSLYPNPANGFVTIQSDEPSVSLKHMEVFDVTGRKVMSEALDGRSQNVSIDKLHSGVYNIRVQTSNGSNTNLKLVVQ